MTGGADSEVLAFFFPRDVDSLRAEAVGAGNARLYDGTHWNHDVEAGQELGRAVAIHFIFSAKRDGARPPR
jgi:membrane-associated phospholipid phosphatase